MKHLKQFESNEKVLKETIKFLNEKEAIDFIKKACDVFEKEDHHPDVFSLKGKELTIHLSTHTKGEVTEKDREVMKKLVSKISDCCKPLNKDLF